MNKNITIISFAALIGASPLYAMELELQNLSKKSSNKYTLLTESVCDGIQEQAYALSNLIVINSARTYLDAMRSSLKLDQWYNFFSGLSEESQYQAMKAMSLPLLHWHAVALCLPGDVVKNHVIYSMLDGEWDAVEQFYGLPFVQVFDLYHDLKAGLQDDTQLVGPLYARPEHVRNLILKLQKKPWYYSAPIADFEDKQEIDSLPEDIKNMYLVGKNILVLPDDEHNECTLGKLCKGGLISCGAGAGSFLLLSGLFSIVGLSGGIGMKFVISTLIMNSILSFGIFAPFCCVMFSCNGCHSLTHHSQELTIEPTHDDAL